MKIKVKDLNRLEKCETIINELRELDSKTFWAVVRACVKIRKADEILHRDAERK